MMTLQAERRQDRMSKLTDTQKMLICVLVDVLLVALVWIFAFTPLGDKCSDAENDISALQSDIDRLQDLVDRKDSFIEKTQVLNADTDTIIDKYGAGNTPEKILMFLVDLSKESNMTIPSISFGEETNVTVLSDGTPLSEASSDSSSEGDSSADSSSDSSNSNGDMGSDEGSGDADAASDSDGDGTSSNVKASEYYLYNYPVTFSFNVSYSGLKKAVQYIEDYGERMTIDDISVAYDDSTGRLTGTMALNMYTMTGTPKTYLAPAIKNVGLGVANLFGSVE